MVEVEYIYIIITTQIKVEDNKQNHHYNINEKITS